VVPLLPLLLALLAATVVASALFINWVQYIRPAAKGNDGRGVCLFKDYLAVVGGADEHYFVALLNKATGRVAKAWKGEHGVFLNCLSVGDRLYAVGGPYLASEGGIYMFDEELNVVKRVKTNWAPLSLTFDGSYLYFAGYARNDVNGDGRAEVVWRIEKTTPDLSVVASREVYKEFSIYKRWKRVYKNDYLSLEAYDIAVNPVTGDLWAVGFGHGKMGDDHFHYFLLVILDRELNVKTAVEKESSIEPSGICFDESGNAYVADLEGVVKFDKDGNVLAEDDVGGEKIACVGDRVYVFGTKLEFYDEVFEMLVDRYKRHALYVFDRELNLLAELFLNEEVEADSDFLDGRPAFDGENLYVAGQEDVFGYINRIAIYSISLPAISKKA